MRILAVLLTTLIVMALPFASADAQDDPLEAERQAEQERKERFRAGFNDIVTDLNSGSLERFQMAIDQEDMLERIFGLRLIAIAALDRLMGL